MRHDQQSGNNQRSQQQRPCPNGSSQNGSSPLTNGSRSENTNGYHTNGVSTSPTLPRSDEPFFGHDREEVTRIILQSLSDLGYKAAAKQLSRDSGYELETPSVASFRAAVLDGDWEEAESLLLGSEVSDLDDGGVSVGGYNSTWRKHRSSNGSHSSHARIGLPLAPTANLTTLKFFLRQQKYLELLERRCLSAALHVLRNELTPLKTDTARLHTLSGLMMCPTAQDLRLKADWDGAKGESRHQLLSEISQSISPSVMIPEHRLAGLLSMIQKDRIANCTYHNTHAMPSLYTEHECSQDDFPLKALLDLHDHEDEIWHLAFSPDGTMLASAGRDGLVCVYDTERWQVKHKFREHERLGSSSSSAENMHTSGSRGICSIAFSPNSEFLISCSQNKDFVVVNVRNGERVAYGDHFDYVVTSAAWLADSETFVIGSQATGRPLSLYSLRPSASNAISNGSHVLRNPEIHSWRDPPWDPEQKEPPPSFRVTDCAVNHTGTKMAAATLDCRVLLFSLDPLLDYKKLAEWPTEEKPTSICFSADEEQLLLNMNGGQVVTIDANTGQLCCRFKGVEQRNFVIRSVFGGALENFIISGSEDSSVYIWRRQDGTRLACLPAHHPGTVNAIAWHPTDPNIFASAGDDRKVRIWTSATQIRRRIHRYDL